MQAFSPCVHHADDSVIAWKWGAGRFAIPQSRALPPASKLSGSKEERMPDPLKQARNWK